MAKHFWILVFIFSGTLVTFRLDAADIAMIDESALDRSAKPCDDFYQFACGGWLKKTEIPEDRPAWSRGFFELAERNLNQLKTLLEGYSAGKKDATVPEAKKLGDYYATCLDAKKAETASRATLALEFKAVDAISTPASIAEKLADLHLKGVNVFFGMGSFQDFKDSDRMVAGVDQAGLTLPDRDYYLSQEGKAPEIRKMFFAHIVKMLVKVGVPPEQATKYAATVLAIETALATESMERAARRDPQAVYHRLERDGLKKLAPAFDWDAYFAALKRPDIHEINVGAVDFFPAFNKLLTSLSTEDLRTYLKWHVFKSAAPTLSKAIVDENFRFQSAAFSGEKKLRDRWKRCVAGTEIAMGEPLGRAFIKASFGESAKKQSREMIAAIEAAFENNLPSLAWMDDATRKAAQEKAQRIVNQIGYPDKWRDFQGLEVGKKSYLQNYFQAAVFNSRYDLDKVQKPVDRTEWSMYPQSVNAYYSPENNKIVFPAGILQSPFFLSTAPLAANFGAIGMVMGHELTHGFDDQGRKFDPSGNLRDWWSKSVEPEFKKRAQCLVDQYEGYVPVDNLHLNGRLTLGENIADQGGIRLAFQALEATRKGKPAAAKVAGFDEDQLFFVGYAQSWCTKQRPELQRMLVTVDPHSPPRFRVNGPLSNFSKFAQAFQCPAKSAMAPEKTCQIW